jgi:hypothetical protein
VSVDDRLQTGPACLSALDKVHEVAVRVAEDEFTRASVALLDPPLGPDAVLPVGIDRIDVDRTHVQRPGEGRGPSHGVSPPRNCTTRPSRASSHHVGSPTSGACARSSNPAQPRSEHYLDYFHGTLAVSPTAQWIADRWAMENPWESEAGPSVRNLCRRNYYWGHPMCWVADDHLALSGIGFDVDHMLPGVRIFNVVTGHEVNAFAGHGGPLFFDHYLYSGAPDSLHVWDVRTREHLGGIPEFSPTRHHPGSHELASLSPESIVRWPCHAHNRGRPVPTRIASCRISCPDRTMCR